MGQDSSGLPAEARIGGVALVTGALERLTAFYEDVIGLRVLSSEGASVHLGVSGDGAPLVTLLAQDDARPQTPFTTGLYHFAILLPSRVDLARAFAHMLAVHAPFTGFSDHLVSEALYLNDPDGNGIEIYRDRPRTEWHRQGGKVQMAVDPLDAEGLLAEADLSLTPWTGLPPGTTLGHIHLRVADLGAAERFYHGLLGFDISAHLPGALFVSAGGYHHHLGLNTWQSRGASPPPDGSAGLRSYVIRLPKAEDLIPIKERLEAAGWPLEEQVDALLLQDPSGNALHFKTRAYSKG